MSQSSYFNKSTSEAHKFYHGGWTHKQKQGGENNKARNNWKYKLKRTKSNSWIEHCIDANVLCVVLFTKESKE